MKCPTCASRSRVIDSRNVAGGTTRRRRQCYAGHRFTTYETLRPQGQAPQMIDDDLHEVRCALNRVLRRAAARPF